MISPHSGERMRRALLRPFGQPPQAPLGSIRMADLSMFPITTRWPAKHPDRLQFYSAPTPNGVMASI